LDKHSDSPNGRVDIPYVLERASEILQCDFALFRQEQRLHGYDKDCKDLLVYWFWQRGAYTNEEIGNIFGVSYSAVSHSVKKVKPRISEESELFRKYKLLNSQIKMCPRYSLNQIFSRFPCKISQGGGETSYAAVVIRAGCLLHGDHPQSHTRVRRPSKNNTQIL